uniref:Uncharacterized protein n=1 Tax=Ditylenchus dipsaci TaxID=166011 RepID=A0A915EET4_9BILA
MVNLSFESIQRLDWSIHPFESIQLAGLINSPFNRFNWLIGQFILESLAARLINYPFESIQLAGLSIIHLNDSTALIGQSIHLNRFKRAGLVNPSI